MSEQKPAVDTSVNTPKEALNVEKQLEGQVENLTDNFVNIKDKASEIFTKGYEKAVFWLSEENTYYQFGLIFGAIFIASILSAFFRRKIKIFHPSREKLGGFKASLARCGRVLFPLLLIIFLGIAGSVSTNLFGSEEICSAAKRVALIYLIWIIIKVFITNNMVRKLALWVLVPAAILQIFGYLTETIQYLEALKFQVGDIEFSVYTVIKTILAASVLFWLGRVSNSSGQNYIRSRQTLETSTKELLVKLFEIAIYFVVFLLLMEVVGIDLTALAVLGGAIGVGIGFGLQTIASNFISGIILLFEKLITVDDIIEMDDGTFGKVKHLGSRATVVETFDGKEVMIPNEDFMNTRVINWSHSSARVRYEIEFGVAYSADMHLVRDVVEKAVAAHPMVLSEPEMPEVEMKEFGDSSVNFTCEFWVEGINEGKNRFVSQIMFVVWDTLKANNIEIPFPQRDLNIKNLKDIKV